MVSANSMTEQPNSGKRATGWIQPVLIGSVILILGLGYGLYSTRTSLQERISTLEMAQQKTQEDTAKQIAQIRAANEEKTTNLASDLELVTKRAGVTADDLQKARQQLAQKMKLQQEQVEEKLASELATKANATDVDTVRQEAVSKLAEAQQDANTKFGSVSSEVTTVKKDMVSMRQDFGRQLVDVKDALSDGIAKNATELAQLRKKGEREYIELDVRKTAKPTLQRVGDLQLALTKTDPKNRKYSVAIQVDDNRLEKKDRTTNEPVQFLVGRDQLRYELVINAVDKDRIRGYLSTPKDKVLSAEGPAFRAQ